MSTRTLAASTRRAPLVWPVALWLALVVAEMLTLSVLFEFKPGVPDQQNPVYYVTRSARWAALFLPVFLMLVWDERSALVEEWRRLVVGHHWVRPLLVNLLVFAATAGAAVTFSAHAAASATPPWHLLPFLGGLFVATGLSLLAVLVPVRGLLQLAWRRRAPIALAALAALVIVVLSELSVLLWDRLAWATLHLSAAILQLYEADVAVDLAERTISIGNFTVLIWYTCSGYEGLALVTGFITVYLFAFRAQLRFPAAFVLFPIGLAASWVLNSVRIAALTSLGAHYSPEIAVKGFHSQGGWIAFLLVTLGLMSLSGRMGLLKVAAAVGSARPLSPRYEATRSHLLPFVGLMVGAVAMSVTAPHEQPAYVLKALLVVIALWACRPAYGAWWRGSVSPLAVGSGLLVGVAWIATSTPGSGTSALGDWLAAIGPVAAAAWLTVRGFGTIVLVPIAEELAFRGYLYRRLIKRDFHTVSLQSFSWLALIASSLLFGALHGRWLAAFLAGLVFALVMLRTGRLSDAVVSHAMANALIFAWAVAMRDWSLL